MIEVMLICWPIGAVTPLHTHNGQLGWMTMIEGKLLVENYRKIDCNRPENQQVVGMDCLAGATKIEMEHLHNELAIPGGPLNTVDKTQTIHRIRNLAEWNERAREHARLLPPHRLLRGVRHGRAALLSAGAEVRQRVKAEGRRLNDE